MSQMVKNLEHLADVVWELKKESMERHFEADFTEDSFYSSQSDHYHYVKGAISAYEEVLDIIRNSLKYQDGVQ